MPGGDLMPVPTTVRFNPAELPDGERASMCPVSKRSLTPAGCVRVMLAPLMIAMPSLLPVLARAGLPPKFTLGALTVSVPLA